ncbi:hypothetical protein RB195_008178 [Necator americanus]|uniref:Uncharacterized protein n=1 Tax=Necator americanus TaxID=51031 RepID=A0ABR1CP96_NECAM
MLAYQTHGDSSAPHRKLQGMLSAEPTTSSCHNRYSSIKTKCHALTFSKISDQNTLRIMWIAGKGATLVQAIREGADHLLF